VATTVIEVGIDVGNATVMLIEHPERFGLSQLHQLRGRVGRGRAQGVAYLLSDPGDQLSEATRARLATLEAFDRLGSGFAISAHDLDLRGGGELVGDEQAGHVRLIGASLYQQLLERAVRIAKGESAGDRRAPSLQLGSAGAISPDYVPDATVRINLYARLARMTSPEEIDAFQEEVEDRFGPLAQETERLLTQARLRALAMSAGVIQLVSGPKAVALTFDSRAAEAARDSNALKDQGIRWRDDRLIYDAPGVDDDVRLSAVERLLSRLAA
jgi:transcription-repair coupling factor (superfamily II helicase)